MLSFICDLFFFPLMLIYNFIFIIACNIYKAIFSSSIIDYAFPIFMLSLIVNIITLPLYLWAEKIQNEDIYKNKKMQYELNHIKEVFKGEELIFMIRNLYKTYNYNPIYSLRSILPVLLQLIFFCAAYVYFTNEIFLEGMGAFKINGSEKEFLLNNLSIPDSMLVFSNFTINVLPIIMTIINILATFILTKGKRLQEKILPIIISVIFLVILYNSPSGLVLFWLFNNIFMLVKIIIRSSKKNEENDIIKQPVDLNFKNNLINFIICDFSLVSLVGIFIPTIVVKDSPKDLCLFGDTTLTFILNNYKVFFGLGIWLVIYYLIMNQKIKTKMLYICFCFTLMGLINFIFFGTHFGMVSNSFTYVLDTFNFSKKDVIINLFIMFFIIILSLFIFRFKIQLAVSVIMCVGIIVISGFNICITIKNLKSVNYTFIDDSKKTFSLSNKGKNVVVLWLDMAKGAYIPYIFNTHPELKEIFDGFTYYNNTLGLGGYTSHGLPSLSGGYDYIPSEQNKRDNVTIYNKLEEAINIMPYNFVNNGFNVTSYHNLLQYTHYGTKYELTPTVVDYPEALGNSYTNLMHRMACFSFMKSIPVNLQKYVYANGTYHINLLRPFSDDVYNYNHCMLRELYKITKITDDNINSFVFYNNELPHTPSIIDIPKDDYFYKTAIIDKNIKYVDDKGREFKTYGDDVYCAGFKSLYTNYASFKQVGSWLELLKKNGVYDNTRIIIVSDHAMFGDQFDYLRFLKTDNDLQAIIDIEPFIPILFVKDFNAKGYSVSDEFMTLADTPTLAFDNIIENPVNPYLNKFVTNDYKYNNEYIPIIPNYGYSFEGDLEYAEQCNYKVKDKATQYLPRIIDNHRDVDLRDPKDYYQTYYTSYKVKSNSDIYNPDNWTMDFEPIRKYNKKFNSKKLVVENVLNN